MSAVLDNRSALLPGRFEFLMGLYAENYHRLAHLFAPQTLAPGRYRSSVDDGLDVHMHVQERHPYTLELELTYGFVDANTGHPTPSAQLRMYTDAHVAEALHCHPGRHLWQVLGPFPEAHTVLQHRLRMNGFLSRWLEYLAEQGHSVGTLERLDDSPVHPGRSP
ncbi:DUF1249 domain-containing protein [Frateuria sp. MAH-13]|uniref:DUF1249 domain-containing protein n=1 Tax=Frateuria flava TaxID=2821489 RepID=A0ABS4DIE3_9GAMM|nr:DUF1249 domain-containing protein [Frateuria flava]MBP1472813.1 DUF1249 domain-containing protein [Frateuria flava]